MPLITEHIRLRLFPSADPRRHDIVEPSAEQEGTILLRGEDSAISYDCGACGSPLLQGCRLDRLPGKVFHCRNCGAFAIP